MRAPFFEESRVVVVLYREPWGKTPWTGVEETAIKDGCLMHGWQGLFFIMLDGTSVPPAWLPHTHVRFNYSVFGFEGAVGAIKARVLETGGSIAPLTAPRRAELAQQETQYLRERARLRSPDSFQIVRQSVSELYAAIEQLCADINASATALIQVTSSAQQCHMRNNRVSLTVSLSEMHPEPALMVRDFNMRLAVGGEHLYYPDGKPALLRESTFLPDLNRARELGWTERQQTATFLSTDALADNIVGRFVDLSARADRGQLIRPAPAARRIRARFQGF